MRILINAKKQPEILLKKGFRAFLVQNFFHHAFRLFPVPLLNACAAFVICEKKQSEILLKKGFRASLVQNFFHHAFRLFPVSLLNACVAKF